jgi:hypothetical protein
VLKSRNIHILISNLSSSEKGYVKKFLNIQPGTNKKYISLFDLIEKQADPDPDVLRQRSGLKNHDEIAEALFEIIMNCLENYHSSEKKELRSLLNRIEILAEKNLYQQAEKLVLKVKSISEKNKHYDLYSEVTEWEIALLGSKPPTGELIKTYDRIFDKLDADIERQESGLA